MIADLPSPYCLHGSYVDQQNDSPVGHDDHYTMGIRSHALWRSWFLDTDFAMLTDRTANVRSDQVSLIAGRTFAGQRISITLGAGAVLDGDFHGQDIQNKYHRTNGILSVYGVYPDNSVSPAAVAAIDYGTDQGVASAAIAAHVFTAATTRSWQIAPSIRLGDPLKVFSLGWSFSGGGELSPAAHAAAAFTSGLAASFGGNIGPAAAAIAWQGHGLLWSVAFTY